VVRALLHLGLADLRAGQPAAAAAHLAAAAGVPVSAVIVNTTVQSGARRLLEVRGYVPVPAWYEHDLAPV